MSTINRPIQRTIGSIILLLGLLGSGAVTRPHTPDIAHAAAVSRVVYTPVEVRSAMGQAPSAWLGRRLWLRARAVKTFVWTCHHDYLCTLRHPSLADPMVDAADAQLPLVQAADHPVLTLLQHAPVLGTVVTRVFPVTPAIRWGQVAVYQVQLVALKGCSDVTCVGAQVIAAL